MMCNMVYDEVQALVAPKEEVGKVLRKKKGEKGWKGWAALSMGLVG